MLCAQTYNNPAYTNSDGSVVAAGGGHGVDDGELYKDMAGTPGASTTPSYAVIDEPGVAPSYAVIDEPDAASQGAPHPAPCPVFRVSMCGGACVLCVHAHLTTSVGGGRAEVRYMRRMLRAMHKHGAARVGMGTLRFCWMLCSDRHHVHYPGFVCNCFSPPDDQRSRVQRTLRWTTVPWPRRRRRPPSDKQATAPHVTTTTPTTAPTSERGGEH